MNDWQYIREFVLAGLFLLICGCSSQFGFKSLVPWYEANALKKIEIISEIDANQNSAVPVDVVFIYDEDLAGELKKISARDWFKRKTEIGLNYPSALDILSWEMVPASSANSNDLPDNARYAECVLLFAFFANNDAPHRIDISKLKNVKVLLERNGLRLEQIQNDKNAIKEKG